MRIEPHHKKSAFYPILIAGFIFAFCSLSLRLDGAYYLGKYLWAEDGNIFINQANTLGIRSLWTPYAGYLHAYPRLIAYIGSFFDLTSQTHILLSGWLLAFSIMVGTIIQRAYDLGLKPLSIYIFIIGIVLQPNHGEVFFNITNSQWMLGAALPIYTLSLTSKISALEYIALAISSLTGPFSILTAPFMILQGYLEKQLKQQLALYAIVSIGAIIQALTLLTSNRLVTSIDGDLGHWLKAFGKFILFEAGKPNDPASVALFFAVLIFWLTFICGLYLQAKNQTVNNAVRIKITWFLLSSALINLLAALYSAKADPMHIAFPVISRYTWIPYTLIFFSAALVCIESRNIQRLIVASIAVICQLNFHTVFVWDYQFKSYVNFSNYHGIQIPINPIRPKYPSWHIDTDAIKQNPHPIIQRYNMEPNRIISSGAILEHLGDTLQVSATTNHPFLIFDMPIICPTASDIGVEFEMTRSKEGGMQLFWSDSKIFNKNKVLKRFYPAGKIRAQFAFPNIHNGVYLRFDPLEQQGNAKIHAPLIYCLP